MLDIQCEAFNNVLAGTGRTNVIFTHIFDWPESEECDLRIDLAMYPTSDRAREAYEHDIRMESAAHDRRDHSARAAWAWMTTAIEVQTDDSRSAFHFATKGFLRESSRGKAARAQLGKYAAQLMLRQHRVFVFILCISRNNLRITRWDRAGCIVSTPVTLTDASALNFIYHLAHMSPAELGFDTTARLCSSDDLTELQNYRSPNAYATKCAQEILDNRVLYPIYKVSIESPRW